MQLHQDFTELLQSHTTTDVIQALKLVEHTANKQDI
jgi:hypothetical protein